MSASREAAAFCRNASTSACGDWRERFLLACPVMASPLHAVPHSVPLHRMKLEELAAKLAQIEEQANLTLDEYPHGLAVERQRLIVTLAKQLRQHVEDQLRLGPRKPLLSAEPAARPENPAQATGTT